MWIFDDWHDGWRLLNMAVCLHAMYLLLLVNRREGRSWTPKKLDYWFALTAWTFTGLVSSIEGLVQDGDLGVRVLLVSVGALVTHRALLRKGPPVDA